MFFKQYLVPVCQHHDKTKMKMEMICMSQISSNSLFVCFRSFFLPQKMSWTNKVPQLMGEGGELLQGGESV